MYETTVIYSIGKHDCEPMRFAFGTKGRFRDSWKDSLEGLVAARNLELPEDQQITVSFEHHTGGNLFKPHLDVEEVMGLIENQRAALFGSPVSTGS